MLKYLLDTNIVTYVINRRPVEVLPYTAKASQHYGAVRSALEKAGRPIGVNDLHIAAHARSEGLTLVTNNLTEFERVPGLLTENWVGAVA
ncbi:MAG: PIN domain-containing protein [Rubrivivax sp.]